MEDLIQNAHILFDERPSLFPPLSPDVASTPTYVSFSSPESSQPAEVQAMWSATGHDSRLLDIIPTSMQRSHSSLPLDPAMESHHTPSPVNSLSPLLGVPLSRTVTDRGETSSAQEHVTPEVRGTGIPFLPSHLSLTGGHLSCGHPHRRNYR